MWVVSVSGLKKAEREAVSEQLLTMKTGIRSWMRRCGLDNPDDAMVNIFDEFCTSVLRVREDCVRFDGGDGSRPWGVCMGFVPMMEPKDIRGVRFWDTSRTVGDHFAPGGLGGVVDGSSPLGVGGEQ